MAPSSQRLETASELGLPFHIELCARLGGGVEKVLALCATANIAYAAYYSALREHFGRRVTLRRGEQTLASSELA